MSSFIYSTPDLFIHRTRDEEPDSRVFSMHVHEMFELYFFISGRGAFFVEGREYALEPGCLLLMCPGDSHCLHISPGTPYERMAIHFSPALLDGISGGLLLARCTDEIRRSKSNYFSHARAAAGPIPALLDAMAQAGASVQYEDSYKGLLIHCGLLALLSELSKLTHGPAPDPRGAADDAVNTAIAYIGGHLAEDLTLSRLAEVCFTEKSYLNQRFKRFTGSTIWEYIMAKRLLLARQYICGGMAASRAAAASGWSDYSSFYRKYKAKFGVSPAADKPAGR